MKIEALEAIEKKGLETPKFDRLEKMDEINKTFKTALQPQNGAYGVVERELSNGMHEIRSHNELGYLRREIYNQDGHLTHVVEKIADNTRQMTKFDDNGVPYLTETTVRGDAPSHSIKLAPDTVITEGNFSVKTDSLGRPVSNKIENIKVDPNAVKKSLSDKLIDGSYLEGDHRGHLIADHFGGPASKENIVPQTQEVNLSKFKAVENKIDALIKEGKQVDYEVKTNYDGKSTRPSSFEFEIYADGEKVQLDKDLQKVYNGDPSKAGKILTDARETTNAISNTTSVMHRTGLDQGLEAAKITFVMTTVEGAIQLYEGKMTPDEFATTLAQQVGNAGIDGYAIGFISKGVAIGLDATSSEMLQTIAGSNAPAAIASFLVTSKSDFIRFAEGSIDGTELAYNLGNNSIGVAGTMLGAEYGAAVGTMIMPGAGTVVGGLAGGVVGYTLSTGAYKTAMEYGSKGAELFSAKAKEIGKATIEYAEENIPEKAAGVKEAINNFAVQNNLPFSFA